MINHLDTPKDNTNIRGHFSFPDIKTGTHHLAKTDTIFFAWDTSIWVADSDIDLDIVLTKRDYSYSDFFLLLLVKHENIVFRESIFWW